MKQYYTLAMQSSSGLAGNVDWGFWVNFLFFFSFPTASFFSFFKSKTSKFQLTGLGRLSAGSKGLWRSSNRNQQYFGAM